VALADAVAAVHQQGVVHRDLKPRSIMIGSGGRLKVLDFGIAKLGHDAGPETPTVATTMQVTEPHALVGTAGYMSPEQAEGRPVDARSDLFSLGVVLYEMATAKRPFTGDTTMALLSAIIKDTPPPVSELRRDAPADLERIIRRCLAKDPPRRYQTALDLRNDLEDVQQATVQAAMTARSRWRRLALAAAAVAILGLVAAYVMIVRPSAPLVSVPLRASFSQITSNPGIEWYPSLSPDGRWLVYAGDASGNRDIYLQSVGGQTSINLTQDSTADDDQPAFSPDGDRIVFRSARDGGGLFVMGRTGEADH
jgi:serine/threonine protein kinase